MTDLSLYAISILTSLSFMCFMSGRTLVYYGLFGCGFNLASFIFSVWGATQIYNEEYLKVVASDPELLALSKVIAVMVWMRLLQHMLGLCVSCLMCFVLFVLMLAVSQHLLLES